MTHLSEDVLAALALGEADVAQADRDHVQSCAACSAEVDALSRVRGTLVGADLAVAPDPSPGPELWERIVAATSGEGIPPLTTSGEPAPDSAGGVAVTPLRPRGSGDAARGSGRSRPWRLLAAALACVLAGLGIGWFAFAPDQPATRVVAATELEALDGSRVLGSAQLLDQAGTSELRVSAAPVDSGSGFVEVWLINDDGKRMVSLGVLDADEAVFAVPPGAVAQGYRIVDLSRELYDDEPRHSGDSIMRGTLAA
jgi:hypothetical protein